MNSSLHDLDNLPMGSIHSPDGVNTQWSSCRTNIRHNLVAAYNNNTIVASYVLEMENATVHVISFI